MKIQLYNILVLTFLIGCSKVEERVSLDSIEFSNVVTTLEGGKWIWEGDNCEENLQTFKFDINKSSVDLIMLEPVGFEDGVPTSYTYKILWA